MTLHYRRPSFFMLGLFLLAGLVIIYLALTGWELRLLFIPIGSTALLVLGLLPILAAVWGVRQALRPDPVSIADAGLRLRVAGLDRVLPWSAIDAVFLEPHVNAGDDSHTHRLVVVPTPGADPGITASYANQADGRPSVILLALDEIMESSAAVAHALAVFGGPRFVPLAARHSGD